MNTTSHWCHRSATWLLTLAALACLSICQPTHAAQCGLNPFRNDCSAYPAVLTVDSISPSPALTGQSIAITVHLDGCAGTACPADTVIVRAIAPVYGVMEFRSVCSGPLVAGSMTCSGSLDVPTTWNIFAEFFGAFYSDHPVTSAYLIVRSPSPTTIASSENPLGSGQMVTFTATVADPAGSSTPTGMLQYKIDGNDEAFGLLNSAGTFAMTTSALTVGAHTITANYGGDDTFAPSMATYTQLVIGTCRVKQGATGNNDGGTWSDAFTDLQSALTDSGCIEIWVAGGTYIPSATGDVSKSFNILQGVGVYGGFAGTETQRDQRDARANPTVLSGDLGGGNNSYHVVWMGGNTAAGKIDANTVLDGFTITGGNANGTGRDDRGGGLTCAGDGAGHGCNPTLSNLRFTGNRARFGAAMLLEGSNGGDSSPDIFDVTFDNNTAASNGGAVYNSGYAGHSSPTYANVTFYGNEASGTYIASGFGGAAFNDARNGGHSNPDFIHVTFSGNSAAAAAGGGAIYTMCGTAPKLSYPWVYNSIAWDDSAAAAPNEFGSDCGVYSGKAIHSVVEGGCPLDGGCDTVLTTSPLLGMLQDNGGQAPTMQPGSGGAAIDRATVITSDGGYVCDNAPFNLDQRGVARPQMGLCDIGAVELTDRIFKYGFE